MASKTAAESLAAATALCVSLDDVAGVLVALLDECASALSADAAAVLVGTDHGELELLSSTSHDAAHLELYQIQQNRGPCIEVWATGAQVAATSADEIVSRWDDVGPVVVDAGFRSVHAVPMRWHGDAFGALSTLSTSERTLGAEGARLQQAFADVASLAIVGPSRYTTEMLRERVETALRGRAVIEQAKGVLRYREGLSSAAAYGELRRQAQRAGHSLTEVAEEILSAVGPGTAAG